MTNKATDRIPVKPSTLDALYYMKKPKQTYDELICELIALKQVTNLEGLSASASKEEFAGDGNGTAH